MEIDVFMVFAEVARGARSEPRRLATALRSHGVIAVPMTIEELLESQLSESTAVLSLVGRERFDLKLSAFLASAGQRCLVSPAPPLLRKRRAKASSPQSASRKSGSKKASSRKNGNASKVEETTSLFAFAGVFSHAFRVVGDGERIPVYAATAELLVAHHALEASGAAPLHAPIVRVDLCRDRRGGVKMIGVDLSPGSIGSESSPDPGSIIARAAEAIHRWRTVHRLLSGKTRPRSALDPGP